MTKQNVDLRWFSALPVAGIRQQLKWLEPLRGSVDRIVDYGCWGGSEPFALLWALDASDVKIVEIDEEQRAKFEDVYHIVSDKFPQSLSGRTNEFIVADMSSRIAGLPDSSFDLAFCENVLYSFGDDLTKLQNAINEMMRVIRPMGYVVAVEPKIGAAMQEQEVNIYGTTLRVPVPTSDPIDLSDYFIRPGWEKVTLENSPVWSYCYRKL